MAQHLSQPGVFPQLIEVFQAIAAHRVEHQKAFYLGGLVKHPFSLLQP